MKRLISKIKNKMNDKSYRKKYRYYYIITIVIPMVVVLLVNIIVQNVVKDQVIVYSEKTLKQFFKLVDEEISVMIEDAYALVRNEELQNYAKLNVKDSSKYAYKRLGVKEILYEYYLNGKYKDVLVWFAYDDRLLGNGEIGVIQGAENYARLCYSEDKEFQAEFEEIVKCESKTPLFRRLGKETEQQYFTLSLKQHLNRKQEENYVVTFIVDEVFLSKHISEGVLDMGENAMLYDENGSMLFSDHKAVLDTLPEEYRSSGIYEVERDDGVFTILVQESKVMKGFYAMEISHDIFWKPIKGIRIISFIGIGLSFVIGIYLALKMSRNTYKPLEFVVSSWQDKANQKFDSSSHDEFEFIEKLMRKNDEERKWIRQQQQNKEQIQKKKDFLIALMEGRKMNENEIKSLENQVACSGFFWGGILLIKHCGTIGWNLTSFVVDNVFTELLGERCQCEILSFSSMQHAIVLNLKEPGQEEELEEVIRQGINFLQQNFGVAAAFGVGNICKEIYGLRNLYRESQKALEYRFLRKEEVIIRYCDIQGRQVEKWNYADNPLFRKVNEFLNEEKVSENATNVFLKHLTEKYNINREASIEVVENFRREMSNVLNWIWTMNNIEYFQRNHYTIQLTEADCLEDYLNSLAKILYETGNSLCDNKNRKRLVRRVEQCVEENYSDPNLNVDFVGKEIGMQAAYLSRLFREERGMLLPNYISLVRIGYAKNLLRDTQMTIPEIAERTGFFSANVFNNNFKKLVGVTPGKYRVSVRYTDLDQ